MKMNLMKAFMPVLLSMSLLAGCAGTQQGGSNTGNNTTKPDTTVSESTPAKEGSTKKIKITSYLWDKPDEKLYIQQELLPKFKEKTGIDVDFEITPSNDLEKYLVSQKESGKWTSDVIISSNGAATSFIKQELMAPLEGINTENITFMEAFDSDLIVDGKRYFYPIAADVYLTLANKDALEFLPSGASMETLTWDQYVQWAENITKAKGSPKTVMPSQPGKSLLYQVGGISLSYGSKTFPVMNDEGNVKAWDIINRLVPNVIKTSTTYPDPVQAMESGEAMLTFYHMAPITTVYKIAPEKYVVGPAPTGPEGKGTIAGASVIGIASGSENKEAAAAFIEFLINPDTLYNVNSKAGGFIAPMEEVLNQLGDSPSDQIMKMGIETLKTANTSGLNISLYTDWGSVKNVYDSTFSDAMDGKTIDKAYLDGKQKELDALKIQQ